MKNKTIKVYSAIIILLSVLALTRFAGACNVSSTATSSSVTGCNGSGGSGSCSNVSTSLPGMTSAGSGEQGLDGSSNQTVTKTVTITPGTCVRGSCNSTGNPTTTTSQTVIAQPSGNCCQG